MTAVGPSAGSSPTSGIPDAAASASEIAALARRRALRRLLGSSPALMGGVLIVLYGVFGILRPNAFPTNANLHNLLTDGSTLLVMAVAMTFVMIAGGFDLSIGSVLVFANVTAAKTMNALGTDSAFTLLVGLLVALAGGAAWGIFNGLCIRKLRVPPLITTLGTLGAALGVADLMTQGNDIRDVPLKLINIGTDEFLSLTWLVWVSILVTVVGALVLWLTRFGRHTYVIGSNAEAARRAGINVDRHVITLYMLSGMAAGLAGMMSLAQFATTTISGHTTDVLSVITGVVLGGTSLYGGIGTVLGTVIGIFIPVTLNNGFIIIGVQPFWQQVATGFILIAAVYLDQLKRRSRDRA